MKAVLTSSIGGCAKIDDFRLPEPLLRANGLLDRIAAIWRENARVMLICSDPTDYSKNDDICACYAKAFPMSGLSVSQICICDGRNPEAVDSLDKTDVLFLLGGHVPTQNRFLKKLRLRERLSGYKGIVLALSAGSMNCADEVYACPELEGEALDPNFERRISGLGITDVNILPHFQYFRNESLDGLRVLEDIAFADSAEREIIALNDGSYIYIDGEKTTVYGEAYSIKGGRLTLICEDGQSLSL